MTYIVSALFICGCGHEQQIRTPINERVAVPHNCRLKQAVHTGRTSSVITKKPSGAVVS
jgi:lipoprotein NlpI